MKASAEPVEKIKFLYSVKDTAGSLGISQRAIWEYIRRGELPIRKIGRRVLIHRREIEKFANKDHKGVRTEGNDQ
jgi:excisionase family DNA binding protein